MDDIVIKAAAVHTATVIFLHGLGDTGKGWAPAIPALNGQLPHVKFILPTAPIRRVTLNRGMPMPAWYDIVGLSAADRHDEAGLEESRARLNKLMDKEAEAGIRSDRIVLAGFSQGGVVSLYTGLQTTKPLAGILALSCYTPLGAAMASRITKEGAAVPVFWAHGTHDPVVDYQSMAVPSQMLLESAGVKIDKRVYRGMGHTASEEELADAAQALLQFLPPI